MANPITTNNGAGDVDDDDFVFITREDVEGPEYLSEISEFLDGDVLEDLWRINKTIHDNPETGFKEYIAHATLTRYLKNRGDWDVTPSAYGMPTAFVAVYDSGKKGPNVSFNVEMDCLPGIGHACGHNLIATASMAGGIAAAEMLKRKNLPGKVVIFGTPAEEGGGGKIKLIKAGAYTDHAISLNLISHPGTVPDAALMRTTAYTRLHVSYAGRAAHAAACPWEGINALDGLITAYTSLSQLRQQTMPGDIIQGCITDGGARANIIHASAAGSFNVRAPSVQRLSELRKKVDRCFQAGEMASGAKVTIEVKQTYADHVPNFPLAERYRAYFNALSPPCPLAEDWREDAEKGVSGASTDQGDVSYVVPSLSPGFSILPAGKDGNGPHSPDFAEAAGTRDAFERAVRVGKGLAGTATDVLARKGLLEEVRKSWERDVKEKRSSM